VEKERRGGVGEAESFIDRLMFWSVLPHVMGRNVVSFHFIGFADSQR